MPLFIDGHGMNGLSKEQLNKIINNSADRYGISNVDLLYNEKDNKVFFVLEGPDKEAIKKHHKDAGLDCDFIIEVSSMKPESNVRTERLTAMGELSARVAHDLRNPLGVIKNAIELIEITLKESDDEKMKKRINMIKNAADRMSRQINDVLGFVRMRPLQLENYSLLEILDSAIKMPIPDNIIITKPEDDITILCDNRQLEVVFTNLLTNSIQSMEHGGEIKINASEREEGVTIEVEDSGPGIPQENIAKIFDPLFTTKSSGTGLGLVSCKNIVEQHGGIISVRNNPTVFTVKLPKKR